MKEVFDINKFPKQEGMLVFGISMSKISNIQSPKECFKHLKHLMPKIILPRVGLTYLYSDTLYSLTSAKEIKKFQALSIAHKYEFIKSLKRRVTYIPTSFSFYTWNQAILQSKDFFHYFGKLKKHYSSNKTFSRAVQNDIKRSKKRLTQTNINFILEEILVFYLIAKGKIKFHNDYLQGHEKWVLNCYPGKPLESEIYLFQKNLFKLSNPQNKYENSFYDLDEKKLYNYK